MGGQTSAVSHVQRRQMSGEDPLLLNDPRSNFKKYSLSTKFMWDAAMELTQVGWELWGPTQAQAVVVCKNHLANMVERMTPDSKSLAKSAGKRPQHALNNVESSNQSDGATLLQLLPVAAAPPVMVKGRSVEPNLKQDWCRQMLYSVFASLEDE